MNATQNNTAPAHNDQHADAYLLDAERAARQAHHGDRPAHVPACNISPAGLRMVVAMDIPIGTRINNVRAYPATLIGASERHALVRSDAGVVEAVELCELAHAFTGEEDGFNERIPVDSLDTLARLGHLLAELQQLDPAGPDDGIDMQTIEEARSMCSRIGRRIEALTAEIFTPRPADPVR